MVLQEWVLVYKDDHNKVMNLEGTFQTALSSMPMGHDKQDIRAIKNPCPFLYI